MYFSESSPCCYYASLSVTSPNFLPPLSPVDHRKSSLKGGQRYDPAPLEAAIKRLVKDKLGRGATGEEMMRSQSGQRCKV